MKKKKTLNIEVKDCRAVYTGTLENPETPEPLVCGNPFNIEFAFDEEWDGYDTKKAKLIFWHNGRYENINIEFSGNTCPVPALFNIKNLEIGVFVDDDLCTTTGAVIECEKSIRCGASKSVLGSDAIDNINKALVGKEGDSAYQVAVNKGFEGTEEEWLASLKGETGETGAPADVSKLVPNMSVLDELEGNDKIYPFSEKYNRVYTYRSKGRGDYGRICMTEQPVAPIDPDGAAFEHGKGKYYSAYTDEGIFYDDYASLSMGLSDTSNLFASGKVTQDDKALPMKPYAELAYSGTLDTRCLKVKKVGGGEARMLFVNSDVTQKKCVFETEMYIDLDKIWVKDSSNASNKWFMRIEARNSDGNAIWSISPVRFILHSAEDGSIDGVYVNSVSYYGILIPHKEWFSLRVEQIGDTITVICNGFTIFTTTANAITDLKGFSVDLRSSSYVDGAVVMFSNTIVKSTDESSFSDNRLASIPQRTNKGYLLVPAFEAGNEPSETDIDYLDNIAVPYSYVTSVLEEILAGLDEVIASQNEILGGTE